MNYSNAVLQTIAERYSCRSYQDRLPPDETLREIAQAGAAAPSAMNLQPWHIIAVKDSALIREMDKEGVRYLSQQKDQTFYNRVMERGGAIFYNAPCMFLVLTGPGEPDNTRLDCGIVAQNIALAASSLGLGNVICGMAGLPFAGSRSEEFRQRLGFPKGYKFGMAVLVGYPGQTKPPHEPDMTKVSFVG